MKKKQLIGLAVVLALVLGGAWLVHQNQKKSFSSSGRTGDKLFPEFPINDIAAIQVTTAEDSVQLKRIGPGDWQVEERGGYPADYGKVFRFLRNLWDTKIVQAHEVGESRYGQLVLLEPSSEEGADRSKMATVVTFSDEEGKELRRLRIGKITYNESPDSGSGMSFGGKGSRYLLTSTTEGEVFEVDEDFPRITGETDSWPTSFASLTARPGEWILKDFIKVVKPKSVEVSFAGGEKKGWKLVRDKDTDDFRLETPEEDETLDTAKTGTYKTVMSNPTFKDVLTGEVADVDFSQAATAVITTFEGFAYTLQIGPKNESESTYPVKVQVTGDFAKEREIPEGTEETEEVKKSMDEEFAAQQKVLEDKLAAEKKLEPHVFALNTWSVDVLVRDRAELMKKEEDEAATDPGATGIFPGEGGVIEAVTPPIAVPPLNPDPENASSGTPPGTGVEGDEEESSGEDE